MQLLKALSAQIAGLGIAFVLGKTFSLPPAATMALQGLAAAMTSMLLRQPVWWAPIHLLFLSSAAALLSLHLPAWLYLLTALLMTLVFWGTVKGDVPLFLSSSTVNDALNKIVDHERAVAFIDLGAGIGSVAVPLAKHRPHMTVEAWEHAPIPWMICAWRCQGLPNTQVYRNSFWECDLSIFDVAFAFLSPAAMPRLSIKALREMRPGALLVSSSFPMPDWEPESVVQLEDRMRTTLYCYRIKS